MKISSAFLRVIFVILSLFLMTAFMVSLPIGSFVQKTAIGLGLGLLFSLFLFSLEALFRRFHLKALNTVALGFFIGYLMGQALVLIFGSVVELSHMKQVLQPQTIDLLKVFIFLTGTYLGTLITLHFADEILISIPFVKLTSIRLRKKDLLIETTALMDPRILDLAATGLIDNSLIMPRFLLRELHLQSEMADEHIRSKARRCLETLKKLEAIPQLGLRYDETTLSSDYPDSLQQLLRLARLTDSNILTADSSQLQIPVVEGTKIINLHFLSNALKPLMQAGESMKIKIQRFGKEPNQGVGYLEDGTMVVVNGGGDFIGENIDVHVLSVKHTSSGRMIFCNTLDELPVKGQRIEL